MVCELGQLCCIRARDRGVWSSLLTQTSQGQDLFHLVVGLTPAEPSHGGLAKERAGHRLGCLSLSASTICSLLDYWIDKFPEEFCRIEHLPILKRVKDYLSVNMPSSDLLVRVQSLQENLLSQVASNSGASDEEASG